MPTGACEAIAPTRLITAEEQRKVDEIRAQPPEDEQDEFNALVAAIPEEQPKRVRSIPVNDAPPPSRRINLLTRHG